MSLSSLNIPASEHCCPGYQAFNTWTSGENSRSKP
jgi:hypothetical protein